MTAGVKKIQLILALNNFTLTKCHLILGRTSEDLNLYFRQCALKVRNSVSLCIFARSL